MRYAQYEATIYGISDRLTNEPSVMFRKRGESVFSPGAHFKRDGYH